MDGHRLMLNDRTIIEGGTAGYDDGTLGLYFSGFTFMEAATMLGDPEKTSRIIHQYGSEEDIYTGFTDCRNIFMDTDGNIAALLWRGGPA